MKATHAIVSCAILCSIALATAGVRKIEVMPVDGTADAALRAKLDATVQKLARSIEGKLELGTTSFADAAVAVGCDPSAPACAESVLSTLGVDELVWGTATTGPDGQTRLVVRRATKGAAPKEQAITLAAAEPADKAEDKLGPLFGRPEPVAGVGSNAVVGVGVDVGSAAPGAADGPAAGAGSANELDHHWSRDRKLGVGFASGGGVAVLVGLLFWSSESGLQDQINAHPTNTLAQIQDLKSLEDKASSDALWGDVLVTVGLVAGGVGAYYLWKDHKHPATTVAPVPVDNGTGAVIVVGGHW